MLLVMEWAPGRRLDEELDRHTLLGIEKALVLRQLAAALQAVHALAIVHRDLKPENVMLDRTDTTVRARLLDFGIARVLGRRPGGQFVTATGTVAGTPSFLSPEQVLDRALDARSDVYSFGVLAYLLVSGRLPFTGASDVEVMQQQVKAAPPALTAVDPELEALIPVVLACLAKKPGGRPRDGAALGAALDAALRPAGDMKRRWFAR
jgi:serine/threonine-protein kinase